MELHFPSLSLLLAFFFFVLMLLKNVLRTKVKSSAPKLPPGPWKLPLIGNMHQLTGSLPHHTLRNLAKKYGPLMHLSLGEVSTIVVSSPEIAKEVLKTHDIIFSQRPDLLAFKILSYNSTNIGFSPYGDYWRQMRKISVLELLSAKRVQTFRGIREEETSNLVRSISSNAGLLINLSKRISSLTSQMVVRAAFGRKRNDQEEFISNIKEFMTLATGFCLVDMYPSIKLLKVASQTRRTLEKIHEKIDHILENILNEHRDNRNRMTKNGKGEDQEEDLVDVFLRIQKHGDLGFPLTDSNIKAVLLEP